MREEQEDEQRILAQMVGEELNRREKRKPKGQIAPPHAATDNIAEDVISFDQPTSIRTGNESLEFDAVTLISAMSKKQGEAVYLGQPRVPDFDHCSLVAVRRKVIQKDRQQVLEIEAVLNSSTKLRHTNLLNILAFRIDKLESSASQLSVCSEHTGRGTLSDLLDLGNLHLQKAKAFNVEILEALDYLHRHGLAHGCLSPKTIGIGNGSVASIKLMNFGYACLLNDDNGDCPAKWLAPEGRPNNAAARRRVDIWDLGIVIMQMFLGLHVTAEFSSPSVVLTKVDFSEAFDDFVRQLFAADTRKRPSAFELLPAEFLRTDATVLDDKVIRGGREATQSSSGMASPANHRSRLNSSNISEQLSRYTADFTEIGRLGKGGFGEVVKARNKLDGGVYAIKKIRQSPQLLHQVLSEVMLLNRLNHPYVVRYFSTWVENDVTGAFDDSSAATATTVTEADGRSDSPRMDFEYQSTGGLDFVSSSGYAAIEFGNDSEEDEDRPGNLDSEGEPSGTSQSRDLDLKKSRSDTARRLPSLLYIQMELCERQTLRDLIRKGLSVDEAWRFVRQITEGLSHIHSHGIIHRDLKPDNVFIDVADNPKIGDFGLATTSHYQADTDRSANMSGHSAGEMTRSVGTALYVAPELRSSSTGSYSDKVDMYSLGIMFFEMCEEFSTAMERIRAIQVIRERNNELPSAYRVSGPKAAQGKLITRLISHKPGERPSSTELLRSDILPLKIEDETIRQALVGLSDMRSPYHQKMMSALFSHETAANTDRVKVLAWDAKTVATVTDDASRLRLRNLARQTLTNVFHRHGAEEEARRESLFPRSGYYTNANVVQVLDASGNLLQLPYDLTLPHARQLARQKPAVKRTFVFGSVYRDAFTGGAPRVSDEVDFDITGNSESEGQVLDDAEILKVVDEIVCEMPMFSPAISFHVNHTSILDAVLENCRIPIAQHPAVKEAISKLGFNQWTWSKVRAELRRFGVPDTTLDDLQQFDFRDSEAKALFKIKALLSDSSTTKLRTKLDAGIRSLNDTLRMVGQLSLQHPVLISPLGSVNAKFYDGMLFQCVMERKSHRVVIAAGGRYDTLIRAHTAVQGFPACSGAVGVSMGLDHFITQMSKDGRGSVQNSFLKDPETVEKRCEVLLVAAEDLRIAGMKLLATLWASDIRAELGAEPRSIGDDEHCFVVTMRHEASTTVRVRGSDAGAEETDVPITSIVSHLKQELRERESSNRSRQPAFVRQTSHLDGERKGNVQVLMAEHRSKKSNKYHIVEAAQQHWSEKLDQWKIAPILAVETRDEVIDSIRNTRLSDAESWRKAVQGVQPNERRYLQQLQDILSSWRKKWDEGDNGREACVFNFRTAHCIYYDLGL